MTKPSRFDDEAAEELDASADWYEAVCLPAFFQPVMPARIGGRRLGGGPGLRFRVRL